MEGPDRLTRLPEDKRQKILDAAIREFAENGFEKASTNNIVKEAGIAKGLLFHYFGSKKGLYLYALDCSIDYQLDYFLRNLGELPSDLLDRLMTWGTLKVKMLSENPLMYKMGAATMQDVPEDVKPDLAARYTQVSERLMAIFLKGVDFSGLRKGVDPQKAMRFILLTLNAVSEKFLETSRTRPDKGLADLPAALKEMDEYKEMLRYGLYRQDSPAARQSGKIVR
ncbi:MAG: TetR/AcrR family transcriptional regulator [Bacillota bacterium]